ncbi:MAG: hypothetical protein HOP11_11560 [Saprospiraceae bacterium]|nr:hypothetical protein [Saprospiraceae bacterium]
MKYLVFLVLITLNFYLGSDFLKCTKNSKILIDTIYPKTEHKVYAPPLSSYLFLGLFNWNDTFYNCYYKTDSGILLSVNVLNNHFSSLLLNKFVDNKYLTENTLTDICFIGNDSLLLLFNEEIICIDNVKIFHRKKINEFKNGKWPRHTIDDFNGCGHITLNKLKKSVLLRSIAADIPYYTKEFFESEILISYSYEFNKLEVQKVYYPDFHKRNYVGDLDLFSILKKSNYFLIFFMANNSVIKLKNDSIQELEFAQSTLDDKSIKWLKWNEEAPLKERRDNIITNRIYDNILSYNNKFYRFYRDNQELKETNNSYNSIGDKRSTLIITDNDFKFEKEHNFPSGFIYNSYNSFVLSNKIYVQNVEKSVQYKDSTIYDVFDLYSL